MKWLRGLWASFFWVDPHPGFNDEWRTKRGYPTIKRLEEPEYYEQLYEYLGERAGEEARRGQYR